MNKLITTLIIAFCTIGCFYQVYDISQRFFAFSVKTNILISIVKYINLPILSRCWALKEILNYDNMLASGKFTVSRNFDKSRVEDAKPFSSFPYFHKILDQMSVEEIFEYTPKNDKILDLSSVRYPNHYIIHPASMNPIAFKKNIRVKRYIFGEKMCYMIRFHNKSDDTTLYEQSLSPNFPGLIARYKFNNTFRTPDCYSTAIHSVSSSKLFDIVFSPEKYFEHSNESTAIDVFFYPVKSTMLPPPYTTMCKNIQKFNSSAEMLLDELRSEIFKAFNRIHTMSPLYEDELHHSQAKNRIVTTLMIRNLIRNRNTSYSDKVKKIERSFNACEVQYHVTRSTAHRSADPLVSIYWPQDPQIEITTKPEWMLLDYIVYVCSSVGIWFGLSALTIFDSINQIFYPGTKTRNILNEDIKKRKNSIDRRAIDRRAIDKLYFENYSIKITNRWLVSSIDRLTRDMENVKGLLNNKQKVIYRSRIFTE